jgi:hypothetical protein
MDLIYPKPKKQKEEEAEEVIKFANIDQVFSSLVARLLFFSNRRSNFIFTQLVLILRYMCILGGWWFLWNL